MQLLEVVSQVAPDGYFLRAMYPYGNLLPNGAINVTPPKLNPHEAARINETKDGWIIEEDLDGLHAPFFDFNEVEQESFIFDENISTTIPSVEYSLAPVRALSQPSVYKVCTAHGDRHFQFMGREIQNRLIYLNKNLKIITKETMDAYNFLSRYDGFSPQEYSYLLFKTKFGIEKSIYCMKVSFDHLIQIAAHIYKSDIDSLGNFLASKKSKKDEALKIHSLIFGRYNAKNNDFLDYLNCTANCYKHSYLQAWADNLYDEYEDLRVATIHLHKNKPIKVSNSRYVQIIYAYHVSMDASMNFIKDVLPENMLGSITQLENHPKKFI